MRKTKNKRNEWSEEDYMSKTENAREQGKTDNKQSKVQSKQTNKADQCRDKSEF